MKAISPLKAIRLAKKLGWTVDIKKNKVLYTAPDGKQFTSSVPGRRGNVPLSLTKRLTQ